MTWDIPRTRGKRRHAARRRPTDLRPSLDPLEGRVLLNGDGFGSGGEVITPFYGSQNDGAVSALVRPDGKIVAVGTSGSDVALARYTATGELDRRFGQGGRVTTDHPGATVTVTSAALGPDGKLLVAGIDIDPTTPVQTGFVTRYTAAGSPDPTFGDGGTIEVLAGVNGTGPFVAALPDGEVVVAGNDSDFVNSTMSFVVEEYTADGRLDTSFGTDGRVTTPIGPPGRASGIALQGDKIIVSGVINNYTTSEVSFAVARYTAAGALDSTFGSGGLATLVFGANGSAAGVAVGPDGSIVVGGIVYSFTPTFSRSAAVARFTADGAVDGGFGDGGLAFVSSVIESNVAVQGDGKILVIGTGGSDPSPMTAVRLTAGGAPDLGFGAGGTAIMPTSAPGTARAVALRADGEIVVAGQAFVPATGNDFGVVLLTATGTPDARFGRAGLVTTDFQGRVSATANSVVSYRGGFLVAGTTTNAGSSLSVARYRNDGSLDTNFGTGGTVQVTFNPYGFGPRYGDGFVAVQDDGKILLVGTSIEPGSTNYDFALARLKPNGQIDPTFGTGGKVTTFSGSPHVDMAPIGVAIQPDGKIVVAGYLENYGTDPRVDRGVVVRYNKDGSLDTSFGTGGRVIFDLPDIMNQITDMALTPDGKILLAGFMTDPVTYESTYFLKEIGPDGVPDPTFGTDGLLFTDFQGGDTLLVRPDGSILLGGTTFDPVTNERDMVVALYTADGVLDTRFGAGGFSSVDFGGDPNSSFVALVDMALQPDGKIVLTGVFGTIDPVTFASKSDFATARLTPSGGLDTRFGDGGKVVTAVPGGSTFGAAAVMVRDNGKIVVVGDSNNQTDGVHDYAVVEYNAKGRPVAGHDRGPDPCRPWWAPFPWNLPWKRPLLPIRHHS